jgi:hypothetical protein
LFEKKPPFIDHKQYPHRNTDGMEILHTDYLTNLALHVRNIDFEMEAQVMRNPHIELVYEFENNLECKVAQALDSSITLIRKYVQCA